MCSPDTRWKHCTVTRPSSVHNNLLSPRQPDLNVVVSSCRTYRIGVPVRRSRTFHMSISIVRTIDFFLRCPTSIHKPMTTLYTSPDTLSVFCNAVTLLCHQTAYERLRQDSAKRVVPRAKLRQVCRSTSLAPQLKYPMTYTKRPIPATTISDSRDDGSMASCRT